MVDALEWATTHTCFFLLIDNLEFRWKIVVILCIELGLYHSIVVTLTHRWRSLFLVSKIFASRQALPANHDIILVCWALVHLNVIPSNDRALTMLELLRNWSCEIFFYLSAGWGMEGSDKLLTLLNRDRDVVFPSWKKILSRANWFKLQLTALTHHFRVEYWAVWMQLKTVADRNVRLFKILIVLEKCWAGIIFLFETPLLLLNHLRLIMIVNRHVS